MTLRPSTIVLAISGPGKCGKDTVCDWLAENTNLKYSGSTSWYAVDEVRERLKAIGIEYASQRECYDDRENHRQIWADVIDEINSVNKTTLYRRCLVDQQILNGIRDSDELMACRNDGLVDLVIWVDRDTPNDPTMKYGPELCDVILPNRWDHEALYRRLKRLCRCLGILVEKNPWMTGR